MVGRRQAGTEAEAEQKAGYVGREGLRAALSQALDAARKGSGGLLLLRGDPGSGKSATLDWLAATAADREMAFARGRCADTDGAPALLPWHEVLDALDPGSSSDATPAPAADEAGAFRRMREITDTLIRHATRVPLVLAIDDLHGADPASVGLLAFAAREAGRAPLLLVATARPGVSDTEHPLSEWLEPVLGLATPLELGRLSADEAGSIARAVAGQPVSEALASALCEQGDGNPLFVRQLTGMLIAEQPDLGDQSCVDRVQRLAPDGIRQAIGRRLAELSDTTRDALALAASRGRQFEPELVALASQNLDRPEAPEFAAALAGGVLLEEPANRLSFSHALFREVLLDGLEDTQRAEHHAALARAIESSRPLEDRAWGGALAHHALESRGRIPAETAAGWAAQAAERALQRHAQEEALAWAERAVGTLDAGGEASRPDQRDGPDRPDGQDGAAGGRRLRARLLLLRGQARWRTGQNAAARADFAAASRLGRELSDATIVAEAAVGHAGRTDMALGIADESTAMLEDAIARLGTEPSRLRVELLTHLATSLYFSDDGARREAASRDAVACAEATGDPALLAKALTGQQFTLTRPGRLAERRPISEQAVSMAVRGDDLTTAAHARFGSVVDALEAGDFAAADRHVAAYGAIAERLRQPFLLWQHRAMRTTRALAAGRLDEAEALAEESLVLGRRAQSDNALAIYAAHLFALRRAQGRLAELAPLLTELGEALPSMPSFAFARAEVSLAAGQIDEARAFLRAASTQGFRDLPDDFNWPALASIAARLCIGLDDATLAADVYARLQPFDGTCILLGLGNAWDGAVSLYLGRLATVMGELDRAYAHLADAEDLHARVGARLLLADTWSARAEVIRRGGDAAAARRLDARADEIRGGLGLDVASADEDGDAGSPASATGGPDEAPEAMASRFERGHDDRFHITYGGRTAALPDSRGLTYLVELLARPGEPLHVLDLVARVAPEGAVAKPESAGMDVLDERARREYRERIEGLREEWEEAEARGDTAAALAARSELEALEDALAGALGLGGRSRRAGDAVERARKSVYNRVRDAIKRIEREIPELGTHLRAGIQTGRVCVYAPERPVPWLIAASHSRARS